MDDNVDYTSLVVHCKEQEYDVLIDRTTKWGNPFIIGRDGTREEVVEKHRLYLMEHPELLDALDELKGHRLGCWCRSIKNPQACHGDLLAVLANDLEYRKLFMFDWNPDSLQSSKKRLEMEQTHAKSKMLEHLRELVKSCCMCSLHKNLADGMYDPHVFSTQNISKIMILGQNPGVNECKQGVPFVGDAGKFFNKQIESGGISRDELYITNSIKCFTISNDAPSIDERKACELFLRMEIQILRPRLVVTLGAVAFDVMCPSLRMGDNLGIIIRSEKFNVNVYPIYHPSPRNMSDVDRKNKSINDISDLCKLIKLMEPDVKV